MRGTNSGGSVDFVIAIVFDLDNLVFQPILLGSSVNLHPLVVILGIMGGSMLFGLAGVLLAVPARGPDLGRASASLQCHLNVE
ncbi:MAG: AI-2E family transporter [Bdellovibrionales bacterium]|nr:AI-2E family transporter [Bdellovibrionales bacterium]